MATIQDLLNNLHKKHGKESINTLDGQPVKIASVSSGSLAFDIASGIGGFPVGRVIEIYGGEAVSKTTLAIHHAVQVQLKGGIVAYIDMEHAFDRKYARALGIQDDKLLFAQPNTGEDGLNLAQDLIKSKQVRLVVIDSVAALTPAAELAGELGDSKMGLHARLMSQAMRMLVGIAEENNCTLLFINQLREKIGVMFGSPFYTTGGNALKYFASVRIEMAKYGTPVKDKNGVSIGQPIRGTFKKNKLAPPGTIAETLVVFGQGLDTYAELADMGEAAGVFERKGAWYNYQGSNLAQGKEQMRAFLADNQSFADVVRQAILSHYGIEQ